MNRNTWLEVLTRLAKPVLVHAAKGDLITALPQTTTRGQSSTAALEALCRCLCGLAPWLNQSKSDSKEEELRQEFLQLATQALTHLSDHNSPGYLSFAEDSQCLVEAAFLSHAFLRAPQALWLDLPEACQQGLISNLSQTMVVLPYRNNWLLFSAMVESFFHFAGAGADKMRIDYALQQHEEWYKGDGSYGDGAYYHWDYYNSFVIQPMLLDILDTVAELNPAWQNMSERVLNRAQRYAAVLERMISPEGSYPPLGRSLCYRFGAFQLLAQLALQQRLPPQIKASQVRAALSAVIHRQMQAANTFDKDGWLMPGFCGYQTSLAENYISTGSLYLCTTALLPLGLDGNDDFWTGPDIPWTAKALWSGDNYLPDHALHEN